MSVNQINVIDSIGIDRAKNEVYLIISDHLKWGEIKDDDKEHMLMIQEKIKTYIRFVESDEIYKAYPKAKGRDILIRIIAKYEMISEAREFFEKIKSALFLSGYQITFERV